MRTITRRRAHVSWSGVVASSAACAACACVLYAMGCSEGPARGSAGGRASARSAQGDASAASPSSAAEERDAKASTDSPPRPRPARAATETPPRAGFVPEHYGPLPNRTIDETKITYFVSLDGDDRNTGRGRASAFRTMQKAADVAEPGDNILVTKGVYKKGFHYYGEGRPDAWVSFVAEPGVEIRGSDVRKDFTREPGEAPVYSIPRPDLLGYWQRPDRNLQQRVEQVFVNGRLLRMVPEHAMLKPKDTFFVDDGKKKLYVCLSGGRDPNRETTEVSMRNWAINIGGPPNFNIIMQDKYRDAQLKHKTSYVRVDGFRIRHLADFSRNGAIQVRALVHHVVIENCDVQWVNYCGISVNAISDIVVRHNIASNNGAQGMGGGGTSDVLFAYNIMDNNNYKGISPWSEGGALKTGFWGDRIVIRGNIARNNHNHGLWIDYGGQECVFENNLVYNAIAGAILDEVTPCPPREGPDRPIEKILALEQKGSILRNNVLIGTRTPGGGGINVSNSTDTRVYNNVIYANAGGAINFGGSVKRGHTNGLHNNEAWANICYDNFFHGTVIKDADDPKKRFFNNVMHDNVFIKARADKPFKISGLESTVEEFESFNGGRKNVYPQSHVFVKPERWDFRLTDLGTAKEAGFDPTALQLDWSKWFMKVEKKASKRAARDYTPVDLSAHLNRALVDEVEGDGKGGWSDQGGNDLSKFPTGEQIIDGVKYRIGTREKGAVLFDTPVVKGRFPASITVDVNAKYDEVYFLYTQAWAKTGEAARFVVTYADGTKASVPVENGKQIYDWWTDPTWQQHAAINDNNVYAAWQGPNRKVGRVTVYHMKWVNAEPQKKIRSIEVTNRFCTAKSAFFLLAISGANAKRGGDSPRVFHLPLDGDVAGMDSSGGEIEAGGFNVAAFDGGTFADGKFAKALRIKKTLTYDPPPDWPLSGQGTISFWLNADAWRTPERIKDIKNAGYRSRMWPFEGRGSPKRYSGWHICFDIDDKTFDKLTMSVGTCGMGQKHDVTDLVKPGTWFNALVTWRPHPQKAGKTEQRVYFDGKVLGTKTHNGRVDLIGDKLYIGRPKNGGQPWVGLMDELTVWNRHFSDADVRRHVTK